MKNHATIYRLKHYSVDTNKRGLVLELEKEKALIEAAQQDQSCFGPLFDAYYSVILNFAMKRTGNATIAQDITAETFFKAMTSIRSFKWRGVSISNWFYKIALNEIRMYQRKGKYQPASLDALYDDGFEVPDEEFVQELIEAQDALDRQQQFIRASAILANLPAKYQEVIVLRFSENRKISDIAVILGKKEGTVKSLLSRALKKLRKELERDSVQPSEQYSIVPSAIGQEAYEEQ